jgi:hypothetical protein
MSKSELYSREPLYRPISNDRTSPHLTSNSHKAEAYCRYFNFSYHTYLRVSAFSNLIRAGSLNPVDFTINGPFS